MNWQSVTTAADCQHLLEIVGGFHDGCLREIHLWTEHYVDTDLCMAVNPGLDMQARMLFQRQFESPSAIEMLFYEIIELHLEATPEDYDSIIFGADLKIVDDVVQFDAESMIHVASRRLVWSDASNWMGSQLRYGTSKDLPNL